MVQNKRIESRLSIDFMRQDSPAQTFVDIWILVILWRMTYTLNEHLIPPGVVLRTYIWTTRHRDP
jgi:hypothetical protein